MGKEKKEINLEELKKKHESDLTKKEKRLLEREKLKEMGLGGKLQYIWMYYKGAIFGLIGCMILLCLLADVYKNAQKETLLAISVFDAGASDVDAFSESVKKVFDTEDPNQVIELTSSYVSDADTGGLDYYSQMAFVTQVQAQTLDVLILSEEACEIYEEEGYLADLKELLGEEVYDSFGDSIDGCHLELPQEEIGEGLTLPYEPACIAVMVNSPRSENAAQWIASLA